MSKLLSKASIKKSNRKYLLVLDVGTSGVKAFVFDINLNVVAKAYKRLEKKRPHPSFVEQDPKEILKISQEVLREVISKSRLSPTSFLTLGITNQRETTICWNKKTGEPVYPAIVWEDTRTKVFCTDIEKKYGKIIKEKTGLTSDSYFSASKVWWILKNISGTRELIKNHDLVFGTIDSWILWNFLENNPHLTDYTNASRTLLFNIKTLEWDKKLLDIFNIPVQVLPKVLPSKYLFGNLKKEVIGFSISVNAVCGDQQASMYAAGTKKGTTKVTYGTGTFVMQILGTNFAIQDDFFTTLVPNSKEPLYALEMKINNTGKLVDGLLQKGLSIDMALTKIANKVNLIIKKLPLKPNSLIVDGGIIRDSKIVSIQTNISNIKVKTQSIYDGTALGVAKLINS